MLTLFLSKSTQRFVCGPAVRVLAAVLICVVGTPAISAQVIQLNGKGPAYLSPPMDDPTYVLTGEFVGSVREAKSSTRSRRAGRLPLGLQIRAVGADQVEAIAYVGGLPGQEGYSIENPHYKLIGRRADDFVVLSGGPWALIVDSQKCRVIGRDGKLLGKLERIERTSPTMHAAAPEGAVVLFDGSNVDNFSNGRISPEGWLQEGADSRLLFQDFNLHVEYRIPYMPEADEQARGNSGLYLHSRYECQILDSFATEPLINGLGAIYRMKKPELNMAFPPLQWQTYDVQFTAPRWDVDGKKVSNAVISSWINGVAVQDRVELSNKTGAGQPEAATLLPIKFQNHGDPVRFRNIWIVDRGLQQGEFPVQSSATQRAAAEHRYQALMDQLEQPSESDAAGSANAGQ